MIRIASLDDIPRMVEMGERFRSETSYRDHIAQNAEQMAKLGRDLIAKGEILISEHDGRITGMLGYLLYDHFISGERIAGEVFWWVEPEARGDGLRLMREAEKRAKAAGAKQFQFIAPTPQLERIYPRLGYAWVESTFQRSL
jgi:GNAT superfamily N-acetyltransferase